MTLNEVKELIELVAEKGFAEFEVEHSGFKLKIVARTEGGDPAAPGRPAPAPALAAAPVAAPQAPAAEPGATAAAEPTGEEELFVMRSPIVGTFYRSPSPTAEPFVKMGDLVEKGAVLCIVEAMKLMNEIEAEVGGEVAKIYVENGQPVEYGQPLFGIRTR